MILKPVSQIKMELGINPNGKVQAFFTDTCDRYMDEFIPADTHNLRNNKSKTINSITYESPYAHYQYIGKLYVMDNGKGAYYSDDYGFWSKPGVPKKATDIDLNYHIEGTGSYWDKKMVSAKMKEVVKEVQNYVNRSK